MSQILLLLLTLLWVFTQTLKAQQIYSGNSALDCQFPGNATPSSGFLYTCNGKFRSCDAFMIFRAQAPYDSVTAISNLMSAEPSKLAEINNASISATFVTEEEVIVPVDCFCTGEYYQANSSYVSQSGDETYFLIANNTYEGLSSCSSLREENSISELELQEGSQLRVPLRCACPTADQIENGIKYLLTYSVIWDDNVDDLSERFNSNPNTTLDANQLSATDAVINPFTTLLIPLYTEPSKAQTRYHLLVPASPVPSNTDSEMTRSVKRLPVYVGAGVSGFLLLLVSFMAYYCHKEKTNKGKAPETGNGNRQHDLPKDLITSIADVDRGLKVLTSEELEASTNKFSSACKIKGSVYRGMINGDTLVAIKKMSGDVTREVKILNKMNHFNLIRLYGVCTAKGNSYLAYEYMENGSLKKWLSRKKSMRVQSWNQRMQIAIDVANGLHYLHNCIKPACIHKNIKSSNILLNGDLRAKVANFSQARLGGEGNEEEFASRHISGTTGYMAPEYMESGTVTPMLDVYAFGVVVLELITGKRAVTINGGQETLLSALIASLEERGDMEVQLKDWIDPCLSGSCKLDFVLAVAKVGTACLQSDPANRPSMDEVVSALTKVLVDSLNCEYSDIKKGEQKSLLS